MRVSLLGIYFSVFEIGLILCLSIVLPPILASKGFTMRLKKPSSLHLYVGLATSYLALILLSIFDAYDQPLVLKAFAKWTSIFVLSFAVFYYVRGWPSFKMIYWFLCLSGLLFVGLPLSDILNGDALWLTRKLPDYPAAIALGLILPFALRGKVVPVVLAVLTSTSCILSLTRGVWLIMLCYLIYTFLSSSRRIRTGLVFALLMVGTFIWTTYPVSELVWVRLTAKASNSERVGMAIAAANATIEHPFNGIGALNFPHYLRMETDRSFIYADDPTKLEAHNVFLQVAAEEGLLALCVFSAIVAVIFYLMFRRYRQGYWSAQEAAYIAGLRLASLPLAGILLFGTISDYSRFVVIVFAGLALSTTRLLPDTRTLRA